MGEHRWLEAIANPTRLHILRSLIDVPETTTAEMAVEWGSTKTLRRHLEALVSSGLIDERPGQSDGETPGRPAARFSLVPEVRQVLRSVLAPRGGT